MATAAQLFCLLAAAAEAPASFARVDEIMHDTLVRFSVKGGAVAVVKDGHLILARGYGVADLEAGIPFKPETRSRWCSVTKTMTAAAIMRLVETGKLDLDRKIWSVLSEYQPYNGRWGDSRLQNITIRNLLRHTAGWDRDVSGDPVMVPVTEDAANATRSRFPPSRETLIR
jgi:N-acyl-D-amino-acid deacylase